MAMDGYESYEKEETKTLDTCTLINVINLCIYMVAV